MRHTITIVSFVLILMIFGCNHKEPSDFRPFADFNFDSTDYILYGFIHEGGVTDFKSLHKDFYIDSKDELNRIKNTWIFDSTDKRMPCSWEYELCLAYADSLELLLKINSECKYLISNGWYHFNPDLWDSISTDKIRHLERDTAKLIREKLLNPNANFNVRPKVLVFPPYDRIANRGISPDIQKFLEIHFKKHGQVDLIDFPYKTLMGIPYYDVFDKKYAQPVLDKVNADIVILSKLDHKKQTGKMSADEWDIVLKVYDVKKDTQWIALTANDMISKDIDSILATNIDDLIKPLN